MTSIPRLIVSSLAIVVLATGAATAQFGSVVGTFEVSATDPTSQGPVIN